MSKDKNNQLHVASGSGVYSMDDSELEKRQGIGVLRNLSKERITDLKDHETLGRMRKRQIEGKTVLKDDIQELNTSFKAFRKKYSSPLQESRVMINKTMTGLRTAIKMASMREFKRKGLSSADKSGVFGKLLGLFRSK